MFGFSFFVLLSLVARFSEFLFPKSLILKSFFQKRRIFAVFLLSLSKRKFSAVLVFAFSLFCGFSDSFSFCLQNLAYQTACLGQYNAAQTKGGGKDPHDFYTPNLLREYFAKVSGARTRTETFYGVCFDYAQAAYNEIKKKSLILHSKRNGGQSMVHCCKFKRQQLHYFVRPGFARKKRFQHERSSSQGKISEIFSCAR